MMGDYFLPQNAKESILQAAIYAPSADNSQPWQYRWQSQRLTITQDAALCGHATDRTFVLSDIALGAVLENITLQAAHLGIKADVELCLKTQNEIAQAHISFSSLQTPTETETVLAQQIPLRCTDRRFPFKGPVDERSLEQLESVLTDGQVRLHVFQQRKDISRLAKVIKNAEMIRFKSEVLHQELFQTVVFDDDHPPQGMTPAMLAIEPPAKPFFRFISRWKNMQRCNAIGAANLIAMRSVSIPLRFSPLLLAITIKSTDRASIIAAGRQIQRVWLQATALGLSVQLYAAPGILTIAMPRLSEALLKDLDDVAVQLKMQFGESEHPLMFLRVGFADGYPVRSLRRQANELQMLD